MYAKCGVYLPSMGETIDTNILERVAKRLREEGDELMAQARVKHMAADAIDAEVAKNRVVSPRKRIEAPPMVVAAGDGGRKSASGWSEFVRANVGQTPTTVDELVAIAEREGKWSDMDESVRRTRIRTTLHTMKGRDVEHLDDGKWKAR